MNTGNTYTWKPAVAEAGVIPPRAEGAKPWQWAAAPKDGFHVLRHIYASIMLEAGESVVTVARWLGHSTPPITLGYYIAHYMSEAGLAGEHPEADRGLRGRRSGSAENCCRLAVSTSMVPASSTMTSRPREGKEREHVVLADDVRVEGVAIPVAKFFARVVCSTA